MPAKTSEQKQETLYAALWLIVTLHKQGKIGKYTLRDISCFLFLDKESGAR